MNRTPRRNWVFTINLNLADEQRQDWALPTNPVGISYCVYQLEIGELGTLHYQGYVEFKAPIRLTAAKNALDCDWAHLEERRGTRAEARVYCMKEEGRRDGPFEYGIFGDGGQGKRTDLYEVYSLIRSGAPLIEVAQAHPEVYMRLTRGVESMYSMFEPQRDWKTEVYWLAGPTGLGKSTFCRNEITYWLFVNPRWRWYWKDDSSDPWWGGYHGQEIIIMDEFRKDQGMTYSKLLSLFDCFPARVAPKGSQRSFLARRLYLTCPHTPDELWGGVYDDVSQIKRRITAVIKFSPELGWGNYTYIV